MDEIEIIIIAIGLAMDAFAVSLGAASSGKVSGLRAHFRLSFHFGLFQFLMPVLGWLVGMEIEPLVAAIDHWIAFFLLGFVGIRMILEGIKSEEVAFRNDPSKGIQLVLLSVATSIDAFAVGFSLAILDLAIWYPAIIIGLVTGGLSLLGIQIGNRLQAKFGKRMAFIGGLLLIGIGLQIAVLHLTK